MSDDTRQARIEAGVRAFWEAGPGSAQTDIDEYEFADVLRARFAAGIDAADAIGRERVSDDEARTMVLSYGERCYINATNNPNAVMIDEEHKLRDNIIALLTAAPAERDETEGVKP